MQSYRLSHLVALPFMVACAAFSGCGKPSSSESKKEPKAPDKASMNVAEESRGGVSIVLGETPIILSAEATPSAKRAAEHLCELLEMMSGTRPELIIGSPEKVPASAIWIGHHRELGELFPGRAFDLNQPEEIYITGNGSHLAILGRDRVIDGKETEFGTSHAIYTFLQRYLNVRWFWPGELGQEVPRQTSLSLSPFEYRFHPLFRHREFSAFPTAMTRKEENRKWLEVLQRGRGSLVINVGHGFTSWWERYHQQHPELFALHGPGNRTPVENHRTVKLCDSNPLVADLWLAEAEEKLKKDASLLTIAATPNDSGGWCLCETCRSWDPPTGPPSDYVWDGKPYKHVMLTDRMIRLWNNLGRGLKKIAPDREAYVGALAYSRYRTLPVEQVLDDNIIIGYVGAFPFVPPERVKYEMDQWKGWAARAKQMMYRPNLFWYTGGPWGLPNVAIEETARDFRFLAENHCIGLYVDTMFFNWATVGPQNYLLAQMAYDPMANGKEIMNDYYERAFGPASPDVAAYFGLMEKALQDFMSWKDFFPSGGLRYSSTAIFPKSFSPELLDEAESHLKKASAKAAEVPGPYKDRVAFIQTGLDFTRLQLNIMQAMQKVRESNGRDKEAIAKAEALIQSRENLLKSAPAFAFDASRLQSQTKLRKMEDYLGPIAGKFLNAPPNPGSVVRPGSSPAMDPAWNRDLD